MVQSLFVWERDAMQWNSLQLYIQEKEKKILFAKKIFISMIFDSLFVLRLLKNIFFNNFKFFFFLRNNNFNVKCMS